MILHFHGALMRLHRLLIFLLPPMMLAACASLAGPPGLSSTASGTLAIVRDASVYLWTEDGSVDLLAEGQLGERYFSSPVWSDSGWLALEEAEVSAEGTVNYRLWAYPPGDIGVELVAESDGPTIYAAWDRRSCIDPGCRTLAWLEAQDSSLDLHTVQQASDGAWQDRCLIEGSRQLYFDWEPAGDHLLIHQDSGHLILLSPAADEAAVELAATGGFNAPAWSPDAAAAFFVQPAEDGYQLFIRREGSLESLGTVLPGPLAFDVSPDGQQVALLAAPGQTRTLYLFDLSGGEPLEITAPAPLLAFYWSPDGSRIALLISQAGREGEQQAGQGALARPVAQAHDLYGWLIYDLTTQSLAEGPGFVPSADQARAIQFFDQYARSHRVWSADSRLLVYAAAQLDGSSHVFLVDAADPSAAPRDLGEGRYAVFSNR